MGVVWCGVVFVRWRGKPRTSATAELQPLASGPSLAAAQLPLTAPSLTPFPVPRAVPLHRSLASSTAPGCARSPGCCFMPSQVPARLPLAPLPAALCLLRCLLGHHRSSPATCLLSCSPHFWPAGLSPYWLVRQPTAVCACAPIHRANTTLALLPRPLFPLPLTAASPIPPCHAVFSFVIGFYDLLKAVPGLQVSGWLGEGWAHLPPAW